MRVLVAIALGCSFGCAPVTESPRGPTDDRAPDAAPEQSPESTPPEEGPPPWAPVGGVSRLEVDGRTLHYANLLGHPRARLERALPTGREKRVFGWTGWVEYSDDLEIEYRRGVAVRLRARVPITIEAGCLEAAAWMGFARPRTPFIDGPRCVWPGARVSHRLEKGYGGEYNRDTRWFMLWLVDPFSSVARHRPTPARTAL